MAPERSAQLPVFTKWGFALGKEDGDRDKEGGKGERERGLGLPRLAGRTRWVAVLPYPTSIGLVHCWMYSRNGTFRSALGEPINVILYKHIKGKGYITFTDAVTF